MPEGDTLRAPPQLHVGQTAETAARSPHAGPEAVIYVTERAPSDTLVDELGQRALLLVAPAVGSRTPAKAAQRKELTSTDRTAASRCARASQAVVPIRTSLPERWKVTGCVSRESAYASAWTPRHCRVLARAHFEKHERD